MHFVFLRLGRIEAYLEYDGPNGNLSRVEVELTHIVIRQDDKEMKGQFLGTAILVGGQSSHIVVARFGYFVKVMEASSSTMAT